MNDAAGIAALLAKTGEWTRYRGTDNDDLAADPDLIPTPTEVKKKVAHIMQNVKEFMPNADYGWPE